MPPHVRREGIPASALRGAWLALLLGLLFLIPVVRMTGLSPTTPFGGSDLVTGNIVRIDIPGTTGSASSPEVAPKAAQGRFLPEGFFTENRGQAADGIRFYWSGSPSVLFRDDSIQFLMWERQSGGPALPGQPTRGERIPGATYSLTFEGANEVRPEGHGVAPFYSNFLLGSDPSRWATHVSSYREIVYEGLYKGIDARFRISGDGLKYEFQVAPGASPSSIAMRYEGLVGLEVRGREIALETGAGEVRDSEPVASQGTRSAQCSFALRAADVVGFECSDRDPSLPLEIDPLVYSTYYGLGCDDKARAATYDLAGNVLVVGTTGCGVPLRGVSYDPTFNGAYDVFVARFDTSGAGLVYATYLGGSGGEYGTGIALDYVGDIYVAGTTYSVDFPTTPGAYDTVQSGGTNFDGYVAKLSPAGDRLLYSTFVGNGTIELTGLAVDPMGYAFVTGHTCTTSFPLTPGAFQTTMSACPAAFVVKLTPTGDAPVYGTLLGGNGDATGRAIAVDLMGNAYVTGDTIATDFPVTPGAFDTTFNSYYVGPGGTTVYPDGFVTELNPSGTGLVYSTFVGGAGYEWPFALALDGGDAVIAGTTNSTNFPVTAGASVPRLICGTTGSWPS